MLSILITSISMFAKFDLIQEASVDISKPIPLYLSIGRASLIDFPCAIISATAGPGRDVETHVGKTNPKEIHIYLRSSNSQNTNMIVRCESAVFVFHIFPSKSSHQDYLKIGSFYGSPVHVVQGAQFDQEMSKFQREVASSLLERLTEKVTKPITKYNEKFGRGRIVQANGNYYFFTTESIIKYGLTKELRSEYSNKYGYGVWIPDLKNMDSLFITGKSMEIIFNGSSL